MLPLETQSLCRDPCGPVRKTDVPHFPGSDEAVESFCRLFNRRVRIEAVRQIYIDIVGGEAAQAFLRRCKDVTARQALMEQSLAAAESHFRRDHHVFPA